MFGCIYGKPLPLSDIVSGPRVKGLAVTPFIICSISEITFTWSAAFDHCVVRPFSLLFILGKWVC